jgi:cytochrome c oxidase assembly factor CtaG
VTPVAHLVPVAEPLQLAPALLAGVLYARRVASLRAHGRPVPLVRQLSFAAGLLVSTAGLVVLGHIGGERFTAHMAEHLLIGDIGALLLVLGLTGPVLAPVVRRFGFLRALAHPLPAISLWTVNLFAWHVPGLHEAALQSEAVHALQHASFVVLGANMWMPLFGPLPKPAWFGNLARLGYIIAVRIAGAVLANVLLWAGEPLYDGYDVSGALTDQTRAASVMMVEGSLLTLILFGWLFLRAAREGEERQELLDLAVARGVELDERRAARAVAAGRGADLRRRIEAGG